MTNFAHITVMLKEASEGLSLQPSDIAIDCTSGGGGHTQQLLHHVGEKGHVLAIDQDILAIHWLQQKFASEIASGRLILKHGPFSKLQDYIQELNWHGKVKGILADLGVSSPQLDLSERGFSFSNDGPLDMRMDTQSGISVSEYLETVEEKDLAHVIWQYGEEPKSRYIAKAICAARQLNPITTTGQLAEIVKKSLHYGNSKKNPATKTFQALRIYINRELDELNTLLSCSLDILAHGGRLAVISFHSLEDRLVKQKMKLWSDGEPYSKHVPHMTQHTKLVKIIKPFPLDPSEDEIQINGRARSAKLRICEKIGDA